ncbi:hypothetical protein C3L33_04176, partial [Rhododendron williamsianum]
MAATEEKEASASDLRRHRRQLSNRESARRTRLRRKKQIEELQSEKSQLTTTNQKLTEELINLSQCINKIFKKMRNSRRRFLSFGVSSPTRKLLWWIWKRSVSVLPEGWRLESIDPWLHEFD